MSDAKTRPSEQENTGEYGFETRAIHAGRTLTRPRVRLSSLSTRPLPMYSMGSANTKAMSIRGRAIPPAPLSKSAWLRLKKGNTAWRSHRAWAPKPR